jgi:hypothetical protein
MSEIGKCAAIAYFVSARLPRPDVDGCLPDDLVRRCFVQTGNRAGKKAGSEDLTA